MEFEWDSKKAKSNLRKHKVSFDEAATAFNDILSFTFEDEAHSDVLSRSNVGRRTYYAGRKSQDN
jgi:uncharacterized DUF497 family protein